MSHWSEPLIGIPYKLQGRSKAGVDCFGLCWLALTSFGLDVPSYAGLYACEDERAEIAGLIESAKPQWHRVKEAQERDLVTFRHGTLEGHIGIVVAPGKMLHVQRGKLSCIEDYTQSRWACRLTGIWRHASSEVLHG